MFHDFILIYIKIWTKGRIIMLGNVFHIPYSNSFQVFCFVLLSLSLSGWGQEYGGRRGRKDLFPLIPRISCPWFRNPDQRTAVNWPHDPITWAWQNFIGCCSSFGVLNLVTAQHSVRCSLSPTRPLKLPTVWDSHGTSLSLSLSRCWHYARSETTCS